MPTNNTIAANDKANNAKQRRNNNSTTANVNAFVSDKTLGIVSWCMDSTKNVDSMLQSLTSSLPRPLPDILVFCIQVTSTTSNAEPDVIATIAMHLTRALATNANTNYVAYDDVVVAQQLRTYPAIDCEGAGMLATYVFKRPFVNGTIDTNSIASACVSADAACVITNMFVGSTVFSVANVRCPVSERDVTKFVNDDVLPSVRSAMLGAGTKMDDEFMLVAGMVNSRSSLDASCDSRPNANACGNSQSSSEECKAVMKALQDAPFEFSLSTDGATKRRRPNLNNASASCQVQATNVASQSYPKLVALLAERDMIGNPPDRNALFGRFTEMNIDFLPSYPRSVAANSRGGKGAFALVNRKPGYADRIFYKGRGTTKGTRVRNLRGDKLEGLYYSTLAVVGSSHLPVYGYFGLQTSGAE